MYLEYNRTELLGTVIYNSGLGHIGIDTIKNHKIKLPSLEDQQKIIQEIEKIESEQSSYASYAKILQEQIDNMNLAIKNICNIKKEAKDDNSDDNSSKKDDVKKDKTTKDLKKKKVAKKAASSSDSESESEKKQKK